MTGSSGQTERPWSGRRVLVTGGSGFVGARAVRRLVEEGATVRVVSLAESLARIDDLLPRLEVVTADLSEPGVPERVVEGVEVVLHFASRGVAWNPSDTFEQLLAANTVATVRLLLAAGSAGVHKMVLAGSVFEYGRAQARDDRRPLGRDTVQRPLTLYGITKAAAGAAAPIVGDAAGVETTTLRIFSPYGPGEAAARFVPHVLTTALRGELIPMTAGEQVRDFCYVDDVAEAFLVEGLAQRSRHGDWNLGTGRGVRLLDAAQTLVRLVATGARLGPGMLPYRAGEAFTWWPTPPSCPTS